MIPVGGQWCGVLMAVDCYRLKELWKCGEYMSAVEKDVQSKQEENRELERYCKVVAAPVGHTFSYC